MTPLLATRTSLEPSAAFTMSEAVMPIGSLASSKIVPNLLGTDCTKDVFIMLLTNEEMMLFGILSMFSPKFSKVFGFLAYKLMML